MTPFRRLMAAVIAVVLAGAPGGVEAGSSWGSRGYGDPPAWCTNHSDMWTATVITSDPLVGTNPEQDTFYGFHANPGYDEWYGYFYGEFRGKAGDASGWVWLLHEDFPRHYHWNFASNGWAVHGHAKQYIAYYNWTFGGECGIGRRGSWSPPPFMADQYGYPVVDIYVDARPPQAPAPRVSSVGVGSVAFTWDPVADQGDGEGVDYFASGMDHYTSWLTVNSGTQKLQHASSRQPRTLKQDGLGERDVICVHVQAFDRLQNATPVSVACARALRPPPMPDWSQPTSAVVANPGALGLVGLDTWFWISPRPAPLTVEVTDLGVRYVVTAAPVGAIWDFGDGATATFGDASGYGMQFPSPSPVRHVFQAHSQGGYLVTSSIRYAVTWAAYASGRISDPYPMGTITLAASPLRYPVEQAQPELVTV